MTKINQSKFKLFYRFFFKNSRFRLFHLTFVHFTSSQPEFYPTSGMTKFLRENWIDADMPCHDRGVDKIVSYFGIKIVISGKNLQLVKRIRNLKARRLELTQ